MADEELDDQPMDSDLRSEIEDESVKRAVQMLTEHFDCVQVFVSRFDPESGLTLSFALGDGNWHARTGQARAWLEKGVESDRCQVRRASAEMNDDDSDEE